MIHKKQTKKNSSETQPQTTIDNYQQKISLPHNLESKLSKDTCFTLTPAQLEKLKSISETVFKLANETLLDIVQQKEVESWMESRYGVVKSLWENGQAGINLMRIDYAWDQAGNFKVLELNTGSHSGWIKSSLVEQKTSAKKVSTPLAPELMFYAKYAVEKLGPKIAILVKGSEYSKELDLLLLQLENLGGKGRIIALTETALAEVVDFAPTGLFWRCHAALVEHSELVLQLAKLDLPQIPSFASLFIAGDKSFLSLLPDKDVMNAIPKTYVLSKSDLTKNLNFLAKDKSVLKPGSLARGEGIEFGKYFPAETWKDKIKSTMNSPEEWVIQELCYLKRTKDSKYEDIIVFLADGLVKGVASRISAEEIVNVSQGGLLQSVVLSDEELAKVDVVEEKKVSEPAQLRQKVTIQEAKIIQKN